jgi:methylated-DNA-[protein]-cysteine S-methyltransferase
MELRVDLILDHFDTPIGRLLIVADREGNLRAVHWADHKASLHRWLESRYGKHGYRLETAHGHLDSTKVLSRYFAGELAAIDELKVKAEGTPFQRDVWRELRCIPCGSTISYGQLAKRIGRPAAVRAVGLANGSNPIAVVVPCHRVIGSDGSLTGYGGGMERKSWLLRHEGAIERQSLFEDVADMDLRRR